MGEGEATVVASAALALYRDPWAPLHAHRESMTISPPAVAITLGLAVSVSRPVISQSAGTTRDTVGTRTVELDGFPVRVRTANLRQRTPGQPVIVFESGGASPLETWNRVLPEVANFAALVAYDRAGTGQSAWDSLPPTPEHVVARLRRLLAKLDIAPPYVLVGHSWGGALIRYFAGAVPSDVVGMLYIDPTDVTLSPSDEVAIFESIGAGAAARDAFYGLMERAMANATAPLRAEGAVVVSILKQDLPARKLPEQPNVSATVMLAGRAPFLPQGALPFDTKKYVAAMQQDRAARLRTWVRGQGEFIVAPNAGHFVHAEAPELVIEAIRRLVR